jgi:hypothetical protein
MAMERRAAAQMACQTRGSDAELAVFAPKKLSGKSKFWNLTQVRPL